jgi:cyanophycinase-like exopeptidase
MNTTRRQTASALCLALAVLPAFAAADEPDYLYFVTGNEADVTTPTRGLVVMQGGGDDVDENYVRMGEAGGGGDFVVLRASGTDEYNEYIHALCDCDSVQTIVFKNREAADDPFVIETIRNAEALFIAGGDQSNYVRFWKDTPVEDAIHHLLAKPAPIGGTSAGMAIMGEFSYSAMTPNSLLAEVALANPYHEDLTIEDDFLRIRGLEGIITDQHLIERDRIGRTVALMARLMKDGITDRARAITADRETSVHLDPDTGEVTVHATADHETPFVFFLQATTKPESCEPGQPLEFARIEVYRLGPGGRFNVNDWRGESGLAYEFLATGGNLTSSRKDIY